MGNRADRPLADRVSGDLPAGIAALREEHQMELSDAIGAARKRQGEELAEAAEAALNYVPMLLRGSVRKAVGL